MFLIYGRSFRKVKKEFYLSISLSLYLNTYLSVICDTHNTYEVFSWIGRPGRFQESGPGEQDLREHLE